MNMKSRHQEDSLADQQAFYEDAIKSYVFRNARPFWLGGTSDYTNDQAFTDYFHFTSTIMEKIVTSPENYIELANVHQLTNTLGASIKANSTCIDN